MFGWTFDILENKGTIKSWKYFASTTVRSPYFVFAFQNQFIKENEESNLGAEIFVKYTTMLNTFLGLQGFIKPHHVIFWLHYSATVSFLLAFSIITTGRQFVGNSIGQSQSVRMFIYSWWMILDLQKLINFSSSF